MIFQFIDVGEKVFEESEALGAAGVRFQLVIPGHIFVLRRVYSLFGKAKEEDDHGDNNAATDNEEGPRRLLKFQR